MFVVTACAGAVNANPTAIDVKTDPAFNAVSSLPDLVVCIYPSPRLEQMDIYQSLLSFIA